MTPRVRIPRSPAALERVWNAIPPAEVWYWILTHELPTIAEELDAREAESTGHSS
jgi:hypothetical protein